MWGKMTTPEKEKEGSPTLTAGTTIIRSSPTKNVSAVNWDKVAQNEKFLEFLKVSFKSLLVNTHNPYFGFQCEPDGLGFSEYDTPKAHSLNLRINREGSVSADVCKDAVKLLYKYRQQLQRQH